MFILFWFWSVYFSEVNRVYRGKTVNLKHRRHCKDYTALPLNRRQLAVIQYLLIIINGGVIDSRFHIIHDEPYIYYLTVDFWYNFLYKKFNNFMFISNFGVK